MGIDLSRPATYGAATEYEHWPKCWRCSRALGRPYPVEHYGVSGREPSRLAKGYYLLVLEVKCSHGEERRVELERATGFASRLSLLASRALGACYKTDQEQRVKVEIPRLWAGLEREEGGYQASATEQVATGRVFAFAPGTRGYNGVLYNPGASKAQKRGLETEVS
jgi:hypothetical protein